MGRWGGQTETLGHDWVLGDPPVTPTANGKNVVGVSDGAASGPAENFVGVIGGSTATGLNARSDQDGTRLTRRLDFSVLGE